MIHTIAHSWKKLAAPVAFLAFFLLLGVNQASAQSVGRRGATNPQSEMAQKFGVTPYNVGTWNQNNVVQILTANRPNVKGQANAPIISQVTYAYYQLVISDIKNYSIAPEITLLTSLYKVKEQFKNAGTNVNASVFTNLYASTVGLF